MRQFVSALGLLAILLAPQFAFAFGETVTLTANDILQFNASPSSTLNSPGAAGGYFVTEDAGTASGVFGGTLAGTVAEDLIGADFHLEMELAPPGEHAFLFFLTNFQSMPGAGADIVICCDAGFEDYLTMVVNTVQVTNITPGALESVNLGNHDSTSFELTITGGTLAGVIESAELFIKLTNPTVAFATPTPADPTSYMYDQDFQASANIQIQMVLNPEPGTGLLLGGALGAVAIARRRNRRLAN